MAIIDPTSPRQSSRNQLVFWGLLAAAVGAVIWVRQGVGPRNPGTMHPAVGRELPALELKALTGTATDVDLRSLRGNVVLINFWATWCPPCVEELPHMVQLRQNLAAQKDFRLLAVCCDDEAFDDLREVTRAFLAGRNLELPTYADPHNTTRQAVGMLLGRQNLDIPGLPTTILLDRQGIVRAVWEGYAMGLEKEMKKAVEDLLKK